MTETAESPTPTVYESFAAVMGDVQGLAKMQRNSSQGGGFMFRGVDDVMNAVGPALRTHRVIIVPEHVDHTVTIRDRGPGKSAMNAVTVLVRYRVFGPAGDSFTGQSAGESFDAGDKATAKAMSVAFRTFLLESLTLPTHEPDPDATTYSDVGAPAQTGPAGITRQQAEALIGEWKTAGYDPAELLPWLAQSTGRGITRLGELTAAEYVAAVDAVRTPRQAPAAAAGEPEA